LSFGCRPELQLCFQTRASDLFDGAEENDESDLTELDIEEAEGLEEYHDGGEEEEEKDDVEEDGIEEELVSS